MTKLGAAGLFLILAAAAPAPASEEALAGGAEVRATAAATAPVTFPQGPFAFVVDPSTPARGAVAFAYALGIGSGVSADRPIPVVLQAAGVSSQVSLAYGATTWLAPVAEVTAASSGGTRTTSALAGVKLQLTPAGSPLRAAVLAGALREGASGANGAWVRGAGSLALGRLLAEVNGYGERVFANGRDTLDYAVTAGLSWRVLGWLRAGAEYVGQDLEEIGAGGAEGGARQAIGPSVALDLERGRYQLVASTLLGAGGPSASTVVRVGVLASF